jgi:hypothetical protein
MTARTACSVSGRIPGTNHLRNGPRNREVRAADKASVDPQKIIPIQITTGSQ